MANSLRSPIRSTDNKVCPTHGDYVASELFGGFWSRCPDCAKERVRQGDADANVVSIARTVDREIERCIPARYRGKTSQDFTTADADPQVATAKARALDTAKAYVTGFDAHLRDGRCLTLFGPPGTGKTTLACLIVSGLIRRRRKSEIWTATEVGAHLRAPYGKVADRDSDEFRRLAKLDLLVIDEVGGDGADDHDRRAVLAVLNARYADGLPIALTTNLPIAPAPGLLRLSSEIGERAVDRLHENRGIFLAMDWPSFRRK